MWKNIPITFRFYSTQIFSADNEKMLTYIDTNLIFCQKNIDYYIDILCYG